MVNKTSLLVKLNMKKFKGRIIVVFLFLVLAALLLNLVFVLETDYTNNFYRYKEELNASDIELLYMDPLGGLGKEGISNSISNYHGIVESDINETISIQGEVDFGDGSIINILSFIPSSRLSELKFNKFEIVEEDTSIKDGMYVSYIFKASQDYKLGDKLEARFNGQAYSAPIKGFYNNISTGTVNCTDVTFIIPDEDYSLLNSDYIKFYKVGINVEEDLNLVDSCADILKKISSDNPSLVLLASATTDNLENSRYTNAALFKAILLAASVIVVIILLIIISIILSNYIKNSIRNYGTLKAIGYNSSSLIYPILIEFSLISIIASIIGIAISYEVFPLINKALESQVGISYSTHLILTPGLISIAICFFAVLFTSYFSILKIKTIEPINAIKSRKTINSKKLNNAFSLDKTNVELNTSLGLKTCISGVSRNIIISICYLAIAFLIGFSCFVYQNIIIECDKVVELICGQVPSSVVIVDPENRQDVIYELANNNDVDFYYGYTPLPLVPNGLDKITTYIVDDVNRLNLDTIVLDGHMPINENEIAINRRYAEDNNLSINGKIEFSNGVDDIEYTIVGLTQGAYYSGLDGYMQLDGFNRIEPMRDYQYHVVLKDSVDIDTFNNYLSNNFNIKSIMNQAKYAESLIGTYKGILIILSLVIIALSIIVSAFVLYILISLLLENKRREYGILKSLGFVSKNIVYQIVLSVIPFSMIASIVGLILSREFSGKLITILLNYLGIFRFGSKISIISVVLCFLAILIFSVVYTIIQSREIRKIAPHELFNRE